jgi:hypothetical protein
MKGVESRDDRTFRWRRSGFTVRARLRGFEFEVKCFKAGQHGDEGDDRFG